MSPSVYNPVRLITLFIFLLFLLLLCNLFVLCNLFIQCIFLFFLCIHLLFLFFFHFTFLLFPPLSPYSLRLPSSSSFSFLFFIVCIHPSSFLFLTSSLTFLSALHPLSLLPHLHPPRSLPSLSFIPIHLLPPYSPLFPSSFDLELPH